MTNLSRDQILAARKAAQSLKPTLNVGKGGVSEQVLEELKNQLKKQKIVKIKLLRSAFEEQPKKELANLLAEGVKGTVVDIRGHTVVIHR